MYESKREEDNKRQKPFPKEMKKVSLEGFEEILDAHVAWLKTRNSNNVRGKRANLKNIEFCEFEYKPYDQNQMVDLSEASFDNVIFREVTLYKVKFSKALFRSVIFEGVNFENSNFESATLDKVKVNNSKLNSARCDKVRLENSEFKDTNLYFGHFSNALFKNTKFQSVDFSHSNFSDAILEVNKFLECDFRSINFSTTTLTENNFEKSSFESVELNLDQGNRLKLSHKQIRQIKTTAYPSNPNKPNKNLEKEDLRHAPKTQGDTPTDEDHLGRRAVAEGLAIRLRSMYQRNVEDPENDPIVMHLNAPWGAGKSSFHLLLKKEIQALAVKNDEDKWALVDFNAWQHQHLTPPWWSLFQETYRKLVKEQPHIPDIIIDKLRFKEMIRRLWGRKLNLAFVLGLICVFIFELYNLEMFSGIATALFGDSTKTTTAATVVGIPAVIISALKGLSYLKETLFWGSADAAKNWGGMRRDPQVRLRKHFNDFVNDLNRPLFVFVDDLDRCKPAFVVELLESIMTTFRSNKVIFMVAADPQWIVRCFETDYKDFKEYHGDVGRSLGRHFLEKVFPYSLSLPTMSSEKRNEYLKLLVKPDELQSELIKKTNLRAEENEGFHDLDWQEQMQERLIVMNEIAADNADDQEEVKKINDGIKSVFEGIEHDKKMSEEIEKITSEFAVADTRDFLDLFSDLVENNPRSMKRLVNAVVFMRLTETVRFGGELDGLYLAKIILWAIIMQRYPVLVDYLRAQAHQIMNVVDSINGKTIEEFDKSNQFEKIEPILAQPENLKKILKGIEIQGKKVGLTGKDIKKFIIDAKY